MTRPVADASMENGIEGVGAELDTGLDTKFMVADDLGTRFWIVRENWLPIGKTRGASFGKRPGMFVPED